MKMQKTNSIRFDGPEYGGSKVLISGHRHSLPGRIDSVVFWRSKIIVLMLDSKGIPFKGNIMAFDSNDGRELWTIQRTGPFENSWYYVGIDSKDRLLAYDGHGEDFVDEATGECTPASVGERPW
jgi:outer membrane protein assembly factor BamB